ncbi:MAG: sensor histidine kinase [Cellulomonadaceae bacterium]|nr:sensor histidine kinase [Cellulomonadaceae bacterium]
MDTSLMPTQPADSPHAPAAPTSTPEVVPQVEPTLLGRLTRDTVYLLLGLPVTIASFTVVVTGVSLAAGLLVTLLGIPVAVATLHVSVWFGRLERARLAACGVDLAPVVYTPRARRGVRAMVDVLADPLRWAAALHGVGALALSIVTWSIAVTWWAAAAGGVTYWFWERWLPADNTSLVDLLDLPVSGAMVNLVLGILFAASLPAVTRWCVNLHAGWARILLTGRSRRALAAQVDDLTARRSAAAAAESQSLRRLERDIHDGPQQRLVRLGMDLSVAERRLDDDPEAARELLAQARVQTAETLAELRALSRGIAPPVLADRGLAAALASVAARCTVPTDVEVDLAHHGRASEAVESAAYFVACEALTNVAKHAGASTASITVRAEADGTLTVTVEDDGVGGAALTAGHGLAGLVDRVGGLGGTLTVTSPDGGPTTVHATIPPA